MMQPPAELNEKLPQGSAPRGEQKRIVLVGATVRAAAQSARRAGLRVTGLDLFGDLDTQQACDQHFRIGGSTDLKEILQACQGTPVIQVGGLAGNDPILGRLAQVCPLRGQTRAGSPLRNAACLRKLAETAGMRFPTTITASGHPKTGPPELENRWLLKRRDSCGGLGVGWAGDQQPTPPGDLMQAWIPGRTFGATFLSNGHTVSLLGVCRSLYTRHRGRPFVFAGCFGPIQVSPDTSRTLKRLGEQVMETSSLRGLFNVDFVVDPAGSAWLLEINPRWSASSELIERRLTDQGRIDSLFALLLEALDGHRASPSLAGDVSQGSCAESESVYLKRILFARRDIRFEQIRLTGLLRAGESIHDVPPSGTVVGRGDPVCTLVTRIDRSTADPTGRYRRLLRDLHAAIPRC